MIKFKLKPNKELINKFDEALNSAIEEEVETRVAYTVYKLAEATPKDTGYAASQWEYSKTKKLSFSFSLENKFLISFKQESNFVVENKVDYITLLNQGWSKQAPAYFIEQTLLTNGFVPTQIK